MDVTAEGDIPLPVAPVPAVSESAPPASAMPGLAPLPEPPPLAPVDEGGAAMPALSSPYPSSPPSIPGTEPGDAPTPPTHPEPRPYAGPMGAPPGYYGQRQFEPKPPPGFSSPLPLPGPGLYDPYAGRGPGEELQEPPPPPSTSEEVWPERQVSPAAPRFQPYYAPPVPGHPAPYTFSPGRGPYGSYPYTR